jgi:hypothetical protein
MIAAVSAILGAEPGDLIPAAILAACGAVSFASACRDIARAIRGAA